MVTSVVTAHELNIAAPGTVQDTTPRRDPPQPPARSSPIHA